MNYIIPLAQVCQSFDNLKLIYSKCQSCLMEYTILITQTLLFFCGITFFSVETYSGKLERFSGMLIMAKYLDA